MFLGQAVQTALPKGLKAMKKCNKCNSLKEFSEFHNNKSSTDGLQCWCKVCWLKHQKENPRREYYREYQKTRLANDNQFKIARFVRRRLTKALERDSNTGTTLKWIGCSTIELKEYLESKFKEGMAWDNRGKWHIDHIKTLSSFDLTNETQRAEAEHYTNLQPLWAKDNLLKWIN